MLLINRWELYLALCRNFHFSRYFFAVPTLMAGNAALLKHAPISTGTALKSKIFSESDVLCLFRTNSFK